MKKVLSVLIIISFFAVPAFAETSIYEDARSEDYGLKAPAMFVRGIVTVLTSPAEIATHTAKRTREGEPPFLKSLQGAGEGAVWMCERIVLGLLDVASFWVPNYNGYEPNHALSWD